MSVDRLSNITLPHLVWICPDSLSQSLDAATWLETTRELRHLGWQVTLISPGPIGKQIIRDVELYCIPKPPVYLISQVSFNLKVLRFIFRELSTIEIVLFHQMSLPWMLPLRVLRFLRRQKQPRLVMDTRTVPMIPENVASWKDRFRNGFDRFMNQLANRWVDGQTAITQRIADVVKVPEQQLWGVWPSGVNLDLFSESKCKREWPDISAPIRLIYVGALHHQRNLMTFCNAVESANALGMRFTFTMVGDGRERMDLEKYAIETEGRIKVIPPVPHEEVPEWLAAAHVGVLPFPDEEKFRVSSPIKLFEYMAAGLPIVATKIVCHTDVVGGEKFAFWADNATEDGLLNALSQAWEARETLPEMGLSATRAAPRWTWQASAQKLNSALHKGMGYQSPNFGEQSVQ